MTFLYVKLRTQTTFENDISSSNIAQRLILLLVVLFLLVKKNHIMECMDSRMGVFKYLHLILSQLLT